MTLDCQAKMRKLYGGLADDEEDDDVVLYSDGDSSGCSDLSDEENAKFIDTAHSPHATSGSLKSSNYQDNTINIDKRSWSRITIITFPVYCSCNRPYQRTS